MWQSSAKANSPTETKNEVIDLIGEEDAELFYEAYRANYVNRKDIVAIKSRGFNAVRLPMHYELLEKRDSPGSYLEEGIVQIYSLLKWCEDYEMYLILDLHCAAGGQSDEPISDYDASQPSLWKEENNRNRTVNLWHIIAERYSDEEWIGGYGLINKSKSESGPDNALLKELYVNITNAIREVDTNHIVYIEGNWFATVFDGLLDRWDENMCYSFHKYWNAPEAEEFTLDVFNSLGQKVGELFRNRRLVDTNKLNLNFNLLPNELSSGVYYFRLYSETYTHNGKLKYLK